MKEKQVIKTEKTTEEYLAISRESEVIKADGTYGHVLTSHCNAVNDVNRPGIYIEEIKIKEPCTGSCG